MFLKKNRTQIAVVTAVDVGFMANATLYGFRFYLFFTSELFQQ